MSKKLKIAIASIALIGSIAGAAAVCNLVSANTANSQNNDNSSSSSMSSKKMMDEVVYVFSKTDGTVRKIISSDWTKNLDVDEYTSFQNDTKNLPIDLKITYWLDGNEISAANLAGKTGKVKIKYEYSNKQMVSGYYIPYVVISGLVLDNDHFKNVELTNAKLINDGNRTIVAGLLLPGMQENLGLNNSDYEIPSYLEISADVTDFTLSMSVSIVTNEVFEDLDFSGLDSIDQLSSELNKLNSAMDQLVGGSSDLVKGIEELYKKAGTLPSGVATLAAGASQLASGASAIDYGVSELQSGIENLYGQINSNFVANNQNLQGAALLTFSSLIKNSHDLLKLKIQLATNETIANMLIPEEFTIDNYDEKLTALSENAMLAAYKTEILTAKASLDQYRDGFLAGINNYTNGVAYVNESVIKGKVLGGINDAENGLKAGTTALVNGAKSLSLGINQLNQSAPALVNGIEQLLDGSTKLSNGLKQFSEEGINKLVSIYNNNVRSLINKIQDIQNVAKNNSSKIKYIYRTDEIK